MVDATSRPASTPRSERRVAGVGVAPGVARGRPCFLETTAAPAAGVETASDAAGRIARALVQVRERLEQLAGLAAERTDRAAADTLRAHALMLADPAVSEALEREVAAHADSDGTADGAAPAAHAVRSVFDAYAASFAHLEDAYLSERAADFSALRDALLEVLGERTFVRHCREAVGCTLERCALANDHVLVCARLDVETTARLDRHTRAIVALEGSRRGHGALVARALGIPAVTGIDVERLGIHAQSLLLVDGDAGEVVLDPSPATLEHFAGRSAAGDDAPRASAPIEGFEVYADLDRAARVADVLAAGADGIGLYRTEMELLAHGTVLDETAQCGLYAGVLDRMSGRPVGFRLFDLGADKRVPGIDTGSGANPALGPRGARLLETRLDLFDTQARALVRAARGRPLQVIYPMISGLRQFLALRARFESATHDLGVRRCAHGVMLEMPAACLEADALIGAADFVRVGSSDLTQYLFAIERDGEEAAFDTLMAEPALWRLLGRIAQTARAAGKPLAVCGIAACDPTLLPALLQAGVRGVSVEPGRVGATRRAAAAALREARANGLAN